MIVTLLIIALHVTQLESISIAKGLIRDKLKNHCSRSFREQFIGRPSSPHTLHFSDPLREIDTLGDIKDTQQYDLQIKKAKKKHIKEISKLCVETFVGDGDDWLHVNREKQRVARDLTARWGKLLVPQLCFNLSPDITVWHLKFMNLHKQELRRPPFLL